MTVFSLPDFPSDHVEVLCPWPSSKTGSLAIRRMAGPHYGGQIYRR